MRLESVEPQDVSRRVRRRLLIAGGGTALGALLLLGSPAGPRLAIPGELSSQHALLREDCGACHTSGFGATKGPLHGFVVSENSLEEAANCQGCHDLGRHALQTHGIAKPTLEAQTREVQQRLNAPNARAPQARRLAPSADSGEFSCATCHREHRGREFQLTAHSDMRCQTCHAQRFVSFTEGHPELGRYPYRRRLRIAFDHRSHLQRHFPQAKGEAAPDSCTDCHASQDGSMETRSFEQGCASCHADEIGGFGRADESGIAFIGLPAVDLLALEDAGIEVGPWPADADVAEGVLTPFAFLLLTASAQTERDLEAVADLDWLDLSDANPGQLASMGRLLGQVKKLLLELETGGHDALRERLSAALRRDVPTSELAALSGVLSRDVVRNALQAWLPQLETRSDMGEPDLALDDEVEEDWSVAGGWYLNSQDFSIRYRPTGHGDAFLRAWLELAANADPTKPASRELLTSLSDPEAAGRCAKCHSIDAEGDKRVAINWRASGGIRDEHAKPLVRFSHSAHLPLLDDRGCRTCHVLDSEAGDFYRAYEQNDARVFTSAFQAMERETCATCHSAQSASSSCLTCHTYHAVRPEPVLRTAKFGDPPAEAVNPLSASTRPVAARTSR